MTRVFENPANGHREEVNGWSVVLVLFLGGFYMLYKGLWGHVLIWLVAGFGLSAAVGVPIPALIVGLFYVFAIQSILREKHLRDGWLEVANATPPANEHHRTRPAAGKDAPADASGPAASAIDEPSDDDWAEAMAEVESAQRKPGLWARVFAQAGGDESRAKANYIDHVARATAAARATAVKPREPDFEPEIPTVLGICPNCESKIPLSSESCSRCTAVFGNGGWTPKPLQP